MSDVEDDVATIGALADPVRRRLYRFVCEQADPVSRDQAAHAVGVARHQAKFHLDRLEAEGLLDTDYVRLTGRTGPGAGRTAKRYRRSRREYAVTLPAREYGLAGHIMAEAITDTARTGTPIAEALRKAAATEGAAIAASAERASPGGGRDRVLDLLREHGYEPHRSGHTILLANCPFHSLARSHTELVCAMNEALIAGITQSLATDLVDVRLQPGEDRCCVTLSERS